MASSFFDSTEKTEIESLFDDLHETFKREVFVYIEEASAVPSVSNYNALYGRTADDGIAVTDKVLTKHTIYARIFYPKPNDEERIRDLNMPSAEGLVRLKVDSAGFELLKNAYKVEVDGENFGVITDPKMIGPFSVNYYEIFLKRET